MTPMLNEDNEKEIMEIVGLYKYEASPFSLSFEFKNISHTALREFYEWLYNRLSFGIEIKTNYDDLLSYSEFVHNKIKKLRGETMKEKPKNNFEEYGFTADFKGEILKKVDDYYIGYVIFLDDAVPVQFSNLGTCYDSHGIHFKSCNLTPIKKEWYEIEDNFPCLVYDKHYECVMKADSYKGEYILLENLWHTMDINRFRPATKEEVLKLIVDEDK